MATLPDPLFMQFFQEFSIGQGVGGSRSGHRLGFVLEMRGFGGWAGAGMGCGEVGTRWVWEGEQGCTLSENRIFLWIPVE